MDFKMVTALLVIVTVVDGQFYEDRRCRCICPSPAALLNNNLTDRRIYTGNVPPNKCNCESVILPIIGSQLKGHEHEFCPRCECKFEMRNTTVIMVVVIMTLWLVTMLSGYMGFLMCLDPFINRRRVKFHHEAGIASATEESLQLLAMPDDDGDED